MTTMTRVVASMAFAVTMSAAGLAAQPDLSGTWEPIPEKSELKLVETSVPRDVPPPPPPPRTVALTITQVGKALTMERRLAQAGAPAGVDIRVSTYDIGGAPTISQNGPITLTTRASTEEGAVVLTSEAVADGRPFGTVRDRFTVVDGELIVESTRRLPAGTITSRDVHRRVSP